MNALLLPEALTALRAEHPVVVIDTRSAAAFAQGHVPGAVNPAGLQTCLFEFDPVDFEAHRERFAALFGEAGLTGMQTAVLYDDGHPGFGLACRAMLALSQLGYVRVAILRGGYAGWLEAGLPPSIDEGALAEAAFPVIDGASVFADKDTVLDALERGHAVLLDVRDEDEWTGASSSPIEPDYCPRSGRIPGARWLPVSRMARPDAGGLAGRLADDIRDECLTVGITPDTPVIVYCFRGARAASSFPLLKEAGIENVKVYFGSWDEWSRDPALPIESGPPRLRVPMSAAAAQPACRASA